jgi:ABC-2 type transport system permease protein
MNLWSTKRPDSPCLHKNPLLSTSYDELTVNSPYVYITIEDYNGGKIQYSLRNSYHHILQWLKDKGYYDKIMLLPKEIAYVTVEDVKNINIREKSQEAASTIKITDPEILQELLDITLTGNESYRRDNSYLLCFYDNGDDDNDNATAARTSWTYWLSKDTPVSETLRSYLKQLE